MTIQEAEHNPAKNFREFERENEDVKKGEHIKVPLSRISISPGFNPRNMLKPATIEKIAGIQASYEARQFVPLPVVRMALDGETAEIVDGECRFTAALQADKAMRARGEKGIEWYEAIRFTGTEEEAKGLTSKANNSETLTPIEQADLLSWYQERGHKREAIATYMGKGVSWVDRLIVISKLPDNIKGLVREERLAAEEAVKYVKKYGDKAYTEIMKKLDAAAGNGQERITPKDDKGADGEGDGGEGSAPAKKDKAAEKAEQKRVAKQYETATSLAIHLPDKIKKPRNLDDDSTYPLELSGKAIKLLIELQDRFTPEIEAALAAVEGVGDE